MINLREIVEEIKKFESEEGPINKRTSFLSLKEKIIGLKLSGEELYNKLSISLPPEVIIKLFFLLPGSFGAREKGAINCISNCDENRLDNLLTGMEDCPHSELGKLLDTFLSSEPETSEKVAYLMAKLSLNIGPEKLFDLLVNKNWSENGLINLSILLPKLFWEEIGTKWRQNAIELPEEAQKRITSFLSIISQGGFSQPNFQTIRGLPQNLKKIKFKL
ncbi:MAG: hypothetical protein HQM08_25450 [Candidatus Riflebacteria bacterium]|nr:hypothetical protein [Candidatus Riflebacteria bacterium]